MNIKKHQSDNHIMNGHRARSSWRTLAGILAVIVTFVTTYSLILPAITVSVEQVEEVGGLYLEEDDAEYEIVEDIDEQYELIPQGTDTPLAGYGTEGTLDGEFIEDDDQLAETESEMEAAGIELWNETEEETETETETEIESESKTETGTEAGAVIETEVETETDAEIETELKTEAGIETETEAETETETETEVLTDAETENTTGFNTRVAIDKNILASDGKNYKVTVTYGAEAGIPEGAELQVEEILPGKSREYEADDNHRNAHSTHDKDYEEYVSRTQDALDDGEKVAFARFFDITIVKDGTEIQPSEDVDVRIELADELSENVKAVHFGDEVEVLDAARVDAESLNDAVEFTASGFSVYGIVGTTIEKTVLASNGRNYRITVTYGPDAGIPENADLSVEEISDESELYKEYVTKAEDALGWEEGAASFARVFDIKIVDKDNPDIKYQPKDGKSVDVRVEMADKDASEEAADITQVVHFAEDSETGDVVNDVEVDGLAVSFEATSFSAYAIVEGPDASVIKGSVLETLSDVSEAAANGEPLYLSIDRGSGEQYFTNNIKGTGGNSLLVATSGNDLANASEWILEPTGTANEYLICTKIRNDYYYIKQIAAGNNNIELTPTQSNGDTFVLSEAGGGSKRFYIKIKKENRWLQYSGSGGGIRLYQDNSNPGNSKIQIKLVNPPAVTEDPYDLEGMTYGLMNWSGEPTGKAVMASETSQGTLAAKAMTVMSNANNSSQLFVPNDSDITMWSFEWVEEDLYHLKATVDGEEKYLRIDDQGVSLASTADEQCLIKVVPGSGSHSGQICLQCGNDTLTYSGTVAGGFSTDGNAGSEWLNLVSLSELTNEYFMTHTAKKVSVSDPGVTNGSQVIIYTRVWNETTKKYEFYAVDSDGSLVRVYESGNMIQWVGGQFNSLLWDFVEYYWEGTTDPNFYYELYNEYSEKYIAPQVSGGQILSDDPIGININGRRYGYSYSPIVVWDDAEYAYAGLKADTAESSIVSCPLGEVQDFYFAIVQEVSTGDELTTVQTINNDNYGIKMRMVDFASREQLGSFLGNDNNATYVNNVPVIVQNLLSTDLVNGYPTVTANGNSLGTLFGGAQKANNLFIQSTYDESGYFEYDSAQNFASLHGEDFVVYKELGTYDSGGSKSTLKHGQFFPYNDLKPGVFAAVNGKNLYSALADFRAGQEQTGLLDDGNPRKYEQLYSLENSGKKVNCQFGMELEASFTQSPSGKDDWGHDIIFEFTGDDDFWLYVDGELVIDLGGTHSAVPGSVNFATGDVNVNGRATTLRELFEANYRKRNPGKTEAEVSAYLAKYFEEGETVFREYTSHTMRIFFMERGGGASNLHMRFNLASVRPGHVQLSKELAGVSDPASFKAEFPYQIYYRLPSDVEGAPGNLLADDDPLNIKVCYKDTTKRVSYKTSIEIGGVTYPSVFLLKPGEVADISVPDNAIEYWIVECGVDETIYQNVTVKEDTVTRTQSGAESNTRYDHTIPNKSTSERPRVTYVNEVDPDALKTLTFEKVLFKEDGETRIHYSQDDTLFNFRLYLGTEHGQLELADMQAYHVKNNIGEYCRWDSTQQTPGFVSLGVSDFAELTDDQKQSATFHTSMNGAISKIPVDYTVEIMEVLSGTKYRIEEQSREIPDGYSRYKYILHENGSTSGTDITDAYVDGTVDPNPHVEVCNLKGYGLRVNKDWSDKAYMADREPTYFAVYADNGNGNLTPVTDPNTVRELPYDAKPQTLYWYFEHLPVSGVLFTQYVVREVKLSGNITVDNDGCVTNYDTITPIEDGHSVGIIGKQIGQDNQTEYTYTVRYEDGEAEQNANVRVFSVENSRPGVKLYKKDGDTPLANAKFRLTKGDTLIGTFTSDVNGLVTEAFLLPGETYTYELVETNAPQGYHGIQQPILLTLGENNTLTVVDENGISHNYPPTAGDTMPTYTIQNRQYEFRIVKKNQAGQTLQGVKFALHKQKTVGGHTNIDVEPEAGFADLTTDENGIIQEINNTLPPGTYELREIEALPAYQKLSGHIQFTISDTGSISLVEGYYPEDEVTLESDSETDPRKVIYTMTVTNKLKALKLRKTDESNKLLEGAQFTLLKHDGSKFAAQENVDMTSAAEVVLNIRDFGRYCLTETDSPSGYVVETKDTYFTYYEDGSITLTNSEGSEPNSNPNARLDTTEGYVLVIRNTPGVALPSTGGPGTRLLYVLGGLLVLGAGLLLVRRRVAG